jgi:hypothetical protein
MVTDGSIGQQVGVFSIDRSFDTPGYGVDSFGYLAGDGSSGSTHLSVAGAGLYTDLQSPFLGSGAQVVRGLYTNVGLFLKSDATDQGATFTVSGGSASSVPEIDPNSVGSVLALVLGSLGLLERRRLKAARPATRASFPA